MTNVHISHQRGKPDLPTLQTEAAILESLFQQFEERTLFAIEALYRRLERLSGRDQVDHIVQSIREQISDLEAVLFTAQHLQLTYLEIVTATADHWREHYEMKVRLLRDNRNFWKRNCHRLSEQLNTVGQ